MLAFLNPQLSAQSLVTATNLSNGTMYSDQVARQTGDLITIQVNENTQVVESQTTHTSRETDISAAITAIPNTTKIQGAEGSSTSGTPPIVRVIQQRPSLGKVPMINAVKCRR